MNPTVNYIPPVRSENKSQRLYRLNEDIYYTCLSLKEAERVGDIDGMKKLTNRLKLLNEQKND